MTHDGPQTSGTAIDKTTRIEEGDIYFGSPYLRTVLKNDTGKGRFVGQVHGHAHDGTPADKITDGGVRVLNPGSLKFGEFAELFLERQDAEGNGSHWKIAQYNKHYL
jgi:Icc-related predicted phosphoesterase